MKKTLILLFAMMVCASTIVRAQSHWTYSGGQYDGETFVYAQLVLNGEVASERQLALFEFAAFVDGELRATADGSNLFTTADGGTQLLRFRVEGDATADYGKTITFKTFRNSTLLEYDLTVDEPLPTFTGETLEPGVPSNPLQLKLTEVTAITLDNIVMNVGESIDLTDFLCFLLFLFVFDRR